MEMKTPTNTCVADSNQKACIAGPCIVRNMSPFYPLVMTASGLKLKKSGKSLVIPHSLHHKANTIVRFEAKLTTIIVIPVSLHQGQRFRFFGFSAITRHKHHYERTLGRTPWRSASQPVGWRSTA
jgi:hypothetical protein